MKGVVKLSSGTIVHKRKLVLERTQHSRTTCQEGGSNKDAGTVKRADYGTIVHKRKLVLELTQCPKLKASKDYLNYERCFFYELKRHTCGDSLFGN